MEDDDPFDDLDETHKALLKRPEGARIELPILTGTGKMILAGDGHKAHSRRLDAGRLRGQMNIELGLNDPDPDEPISGIKHRVLEDGTTVTLNNFGGVTKTHISHPYTPPDEEHETAPPPVEEPELSFQPFLWVGVKFLGGGTPKTPQQSGYEPDERLAFAHLAVWEPAEVDHSDGSDNEEDFNIVSNRDDILSKRMETFGGMWTLHGSADDEVFESEDPSIEYPLGPNNSENLEAWQNPDFETLTGEEEDDVWEVIVRSKRINTDDDEGWEDWSGAGSKHAKTGDYHVKLQLYMNGYLDWVNIEPSRFLVRVVVGRAENETLIRTYEVELHESTGYLMGILPKGWYPDLRNYPDSASESCNSCAANIADFGPNAHGGSWWQQGVRITMPPPQQDVPRSYFAWPEAWKPAGDLELIPSVGFGDEIPDDSAEQGEGIGDAVPAIIIGEWPDRIKRAGGCVQASTQYFRITLQTTLGLLGYSGAQVKINPQGPSGCPTDPPASFTWSNIFDGDPDLKKLYTVERFAGVYRAVTGDATSTITLHPAEGPGNGIQIWQEGSCYGATMDVMIDVTPPVHQGIIDLVEAPLSPLSNPMITYKKTISASSGSAGSEYGEGQRPTTYSQTVITVDSSEAEWTAAGGAGGYFSAQFVAALDCDRILEVF